MLRGRKLNRRLDTWLGIPSVNLLASLRRRRTLPSTVRHVGVMCSAALGDTLLFSGVLADLRRARPELRITHICTEHNRAAAEIITGADALLEIGLTRPVQTVSAMRALRLDVLLDFTGWQRLTALYTMAAGAKFTVGFASLGQRRGRAYDLAVPHRRDLHEMDNLRALLDASGLTPGLVGHAPPAVRVETPEHPPFADEEDIVCLHPWASGQRSKLREWPEARWLEAATELERRGTLFVVTGAPWDRKRAEVLAKALRGRGVRAEVFISPDGLKTLAWLLRRARLVLSVNTGIMHLAALVGTRVISLNGPNAATRWGGIGPCVENIQPPDGSGGFLHLGFEFDGQPKDIMQRMTVAQVVEAAARLEGCGQ